MREHKIFSGVMGLLFALMWLGGLGACSGTKAPPTAAAVSTAAPAHRTAEAEWRAMAYQACTHWVTPESVGAAAFEEYELADKLEQREFERWVVGQYVVCAYEAPEEQRSTGNPTMTIRYLFEVTTGHLVRVEISWQRGGGSRPQGGCSFGQESCSAYINPETVGQALWDHYDLAARLEDDSLVSMCSFGELHCLTGHSVDGVEVDLDQLLFSIDVASHELDYWCVRWREDLPESIPAAALSNAEARSRFQGRLLHPLQLQLISPEDSPTHYAEDVASPYASDIPVNKESYYRPSWCAASEEGPDWNTVCYTCIDAVSGEVSKRSCRERGH
jgi:hypothetical protein